MEEESVNYVLFPNREERLDSLSSGSIGYRRSSNFLSRSRPDSRRTLLDGGELNRRNSGSDVNRNIAYAYAHRERIDRHHNLQDLPGYHFYSAASVIHEDSYESLGRKRHLMESRGALQIPPVSTILIFFFVIIYLFREKLHVQKEQDVCVSFKLVWEKRQVWRIFVSQFFHFNKLNVLINSFTLFTVGRYLERKVTKSAMLIVIIAMSATAHIIYIFINPIVCNPRQPQFIIGFGHVIYSLRVLLAYALEPRNYERDLVFGLYPMVVSASHAPWQPLLDLTIFKIVLPEQCIAGQVSGVAAGFLISIILLMWPTKGIYIARPPYYWTMMGTPDPSKPPESGSTKTSEEHDPWTMQAYTDSDFWLPLTPKGMTPPSPYLSTESSSTTTNQVDLNGEARSAPNQVLMGSNSLERRSIELKARASNFLAHPTESILSLMASLRPKESWQRGKGQRKKPETMNERRAKPKRKRKTQPINEEESGLRRVPDQMEIRPLNQETPSKEQSLNAGASTELVRKRRSSNSEKGFTVIFNNNLEDSIESLSRCRSRQVYGLYDDND